MKYNLKDYALLKEQINYSLSNKEIINLKKINSNLSIDEIKNTYLPLSRLLNLYISSNITQYSTFTNLLHTTTHTHINKIPYIIGISGSVASGKSTTAKILQLLLKKWSEHHIIELVATDGFLYSNQILKQKNLMQKKGFPQSYDIQKLINFVIQIKSVTQSTTIPIYSHITYDIIHNVQKTIKVPNVLILEGLNVLKNDDKYYKPHPSFLTFNFIDCFIYIDAPESLLREWYIRRFLKLCNIALSYPNSHFFRYAQLSKHKLISIASSLWTNINSLNLKNHISPTKIHANLVLNKGENHIIHSILFKKSEN